ncbi:AMP-binding protein [Aquabacterium sp.]|uniref:AMP-binding protein n=1 Tax=Aquabacterium sp. TaxID=1872578 RepID=UPI002D1D7E7C|nr:AMP-binding protein [Aquabacterium sp.]HSW06489.1 AMP-binding protein [Aquabacterium sp.]
MNITHDLIEQARRNPGAPALLLSNRTVSYRELDQLTWRSAAFLHEAGIRRGDVIALTFVDEALLALAMLGLNRLGATMVSMAQSATAAQRAQWAAAARARLLLSDRPQRFAGTLPAVALGADQILARTGPVDLALIDEDPRAPLAMRIGSGSTGRQKLMAISHRQQAERNRILNLAEGNSSADRAVAMPHLEYGTAHQRLMATLAAGAAFALLDRAREDVIALLQELSPTILHLTVHHAEALLQRLPAASAGPVLQARILTIGSSTVPERLRRRVASRLARNVHVNYGTNEAGTIALAGPAQALETPGSVGKPVSGVELEIVDAHRQPLPRGATGQIRIRSAALIDGYPDDEEASRAAFAEGWFYPGDTGRFTEGGELVFCGRSDDMMIMSGVNIYPVEIEQVMAAHPAVQEVAAMPFRHPVYQDVPVCAVALREGATASEASLRAYAREHLGFRSPHRVFVLDRIPRNAMGKPQRAELRRLMQPAAPVVAAASPALQPARTIGVADVGGAAAADGRALVGQPSGQFSFGFDCPETVDIAQLDLWLSQALEIDVAAVPGEHAAAFSIGAPGTAQSSAALFLDRSLRLAGALLQAGRMPVFDAAQVVSLKQQPRDGGTAWSALVRMPLVEQMPARAYQLAVTASFQLCAWAASQPWSEAGRDQLHARVAEQVLVPLKRMVPAGKSTIPVLRGAHRLGMPFIHLGGGSYQLGWGSKGRRMDRSSTEHDSMLGAKLCGSKPLSGALLRRAGLPAPVHEAVATPDKALAAARKLGWPLVVKPADQERGEGVTVDVGSEAQLLAAFALALGLSRQKLVLVERQVPGVCHRLFIADGKLLYAVKRLPMSVFGDGRASVAVLVEHELQAQRRRPPWLRSEIAPLDDEAIAALQAAGFTPASVPPAGARVSLRRIESTRWGGVDEEVSDRIHPENLAIALRAAALFGLHMAGIDIITPDIARPWHENGAILNEVNFAPLFGGGEISRRLIPVFLQDFIDGDGRIPIEHFKGGDATMPAALARQQALVATGLRCFLTTAERTLEPAGTEWQMPVRGLLRRARALLLDREVDAIVLVG